MKNQISNVVPFPQEGDHQAHVQLLGFLESGGGKHLGLTVQKYLERGDLRPSEDFSGKYMLSVERHRAAAGCSYQKGVPMAAYETYVQELIFDPAVASLTGYCEIHKNHTIDVHALASEQMSDYIPTVEMSHGSSLRKIELSVIGWDMTTSSLTEAKAEVEEQIRNMCLEGIFEYLDGVYDEYPCIESEFEDACVEYVIEKLEKAWDDPQMLDDE